MLMNDLLKTEFFGLITKNSQEITTQEIQNAYGMLIAHIDAISQEDNLKNVIRKLNFTRAELVFLSTQIQHEQGEKCPEICLSSKGIILS